MWHNKGTMSVNKLIYAIMRIMLDRYDKYFISIIRSKIITCVSANMPKKIRVGRSENLFIFCQFLFIRKRSKIFIGAKYHQQYLKSYI